MITPNKNYGEFLAGCIHGVVTAVPRNVVLNDDFLNDERTAAVEASRLTGVVERRHASRGQTTESLGTAAARRLIDNLGWLPEQISALVYVTQTPGIAVPAGGYQIAADLGLASHCPVVEVNWSCAGYVYGLWLAMKLAAVDSLLTTRHVLLIVGDTTSTILDGDDRATAPLFGDAVSATAVVNGPLSGLSYFVLGTDGRGVERLKQENDGFLQMDGAAVFNFTLKHVPGLVADVLDNDPPDFLLFHQANKFMLDHLVKKMQLLDSFSPEQIPMNVEHFGNTSSASIPLVLCDKLGVTGARGTRLALFGYGAGWAWGGASLDAHSLQCAELLEI